VKDKWKTGVNLCGPRHPEWDASPETEAKSCGPGMQPFERSKNPIQVNLFGELKLRKPSPLKAFQKKHTWATFFPPKFDLNDDPNMGRRTLSWRYSRVWVGNI